jgi:hypothetical protein
VGLKLTVGIGDTFGDDIGIENRRNSYEVSITIHPGRIKCMTSYIGHTSERNMNAMKKKLTRRGKAQLVP